MRKTSKKVSNETSPELYEQVGKTDNSKKSLDASREQIIEIIESGRRSALEVVSEMMCITLEEVLELLRVNGIEEEELNREKLFFSNISSLDLSAMLTKSNEGTLRNFLLGNNKASFLISFLDFRTLSKESLQSSYKKAFEKWTIEEEMILAGLYNEGKSWKEISEHLQRNINAIKIRVEKLGLAEDTGAKRRY